MLTGLRDARYDVLALHRAAPILQHDMPTATNDLEDGSIGFEIPVAELVSGDGGEAPSTQRKRRRLTELGWSRSNVTVRKLVGFDEVEVETQSLLRASLPSSIAGRGVTAGLLRPRAQRSE